MDGIAETSESFPHPSSQYRGRIAPSPSGHLHGKSSRLLQMALKIIEFTALTLFMNLVGHAQTFFIAKQRAKRFGGKLVLRIEDIDIQRCKPHFLSDMTEDLNWFQLQSDEGYGSSASNDEDFVQSKRFGWYKQAWKILYDLGYIYPCSLSRRDVDHALSAPQETSNNAPQGETQQASSSSSGSNNENSNYINSTVNTIPNEPVLPIHLRPDFIQTAPYRPGNHNHFPPQFQNLSDPTDVRINWRFRVPDYCSVNSEEVEDATITFTDISCGDQSFTSMRDFGDFLVWRLDGYPSYELAVVVDDILMNITEVVRGQDLLISTCRQLLLMRAIFGLDFRKPEAWFPVASEINSNCNSAAEIAAEEEAPTAKRPRNHTITDTNQRSEGWSYSRLRHKNNSILDDLQYFRIPQYFHAPLMCDETGRRLAKRNFAKSLRKMREEGMTAEEVKNRYFNPALLN